MNCWSISLFMVTRDVLKDFKIALAYGSFNFDNFQNITLAHKSRNALAFKRFPILIIQQIVTLSKYGHIALDICHPNVTRQRKL